MVLNSYFPHTAALHLILLSSHLPNPTLSPACNQYSHMNSASYDYKIYNFKLNTETTKAVSAGQKQFISHVKIFLFIDEFKFHWSLREIYGDRCCFRCKVRVQS